MVISEISSEAIYGCMDNQACNYNENANTDDGSCEYAENNYDLDAKFWVQKLILKKYFKKN